jgi:hypothetical protein
VQGGGTRPVKHSAIAELLFCHTGYVTIANAVLCEVRSV